MEIKAYGKTVKVRPENITEALRIEERYSRIVEVGYALKKDRFCNLTVTDPEISFRWEVVYLVMDVKRILGAP